MGVCSKCKQNANFIVKDAQQICGRCGATTTVAKLQTEDFKGIKIKKSYISEKRDRRVSKTPTSERHIEENWGMYLEAYQRMLRESVRVVRQKLQLEDNFEEKAKYYWFEYLGVFREGKLPLIAFFTIPKQGNRQGKVYADSISKRSLYVSKYSHRRSTLREVEGVEDEEQTVDMSLDLYDQDFVEKLLLQKNTQDQQKQILEENEDINQIFLQFEDVDKNRGVEGQSQREIDLKQQQIPAFTGKDGQQQRQTVKGEMQKYSLQAQIDLEQRKKKRRKMKGKLNYIENMEECGRNYLMLVLERSDDYVRTLYNGFRSAYLNMLYMEEREQNPMKRIRKLKESSKGYAISKQFVYKQIEKRKIPFAKRQNYDKIDVFHLIWAWDWAEFISGQSQVQFMLREEVSLLYDYLERMLQVISKQLKEQQTFEMELSKNKQQLNRSKKLFEIKKKLVKEKIHSGYLSGGEHENEGDAEDKEESHQHEQITKATPRRKIPLESNELFDLFAAKTIQNNNSLTFIPSKLVQKSDEREDQEKVIEELEFQYSRFHTKKIISLDEEQLLTLKAIVEEILGERDIICSRMETPLNPLLFENPTKRKRRSLSKKKKNVKEIDGKINEGKEDNNKMDQEKEEDNNQDDRILPLEYNLIPTIIYLALYSVGEIYSPQDVNLWMKNGFFPFNLGISPYLKISDPRIYWMNPPSIPSSSFIRMNARRFLLMTNHSVSLSRKRLFRQSLQMVSRFRLPLDWACMIYLMSVKVHRDEKNNIGLEETEQFDCDLLVAGSFIVLLKMIYGLNDEMFGVLLSQDILDEVKEFITEQQHSFLAAIVKYFENTRFIKTISFYHSVPTFKQVVLSIYTYIQERDSSDTQLDLTEYSQMTSLSSSNLLLLLDSFIHSHKLAALHSKIAHPKTMTQEQQQNATNSQNPTNMSERTAQMHFDDLEVHPPLLKTLNTHLENISSSYNPDHCTSMEQPPTFSVTKSFEFPQRSHDKFSKQFSACLESDLSYIATHVIKKGKSILPPSYDYEIDKNYQIDSNLLSKELKFIVDQLAHYTGEDSLLIMKYLEKVESKIQKLIQVNNKAQKLTSHGAFLDIVSSKLSKSN